MKEYDIVKLLVDRPRYERLGVTILKYSLALLLRRAFLFPISFRRMPPKPTQIFCPPIDFGG